MDIFSVLNVNMLEGCRIHAHMKAGGFEPDTLKAFCTYVRPDSTVIDVGAYTGLFSLLAVKMRAKAIAFEPLPQNIERLQQNVALNHARVDLVEGAASDKRGSALLLYNDRVLFTSGASLAALTGKASIKVPTITIDSLKADRVSVIKIDVEGHEPAVLRGAKETIRLWQPVIFAEANDQRAADAILRELHGYEHRATLDGRNLLLLPRQ